MPTCVRLRTQVIILQTTGEIFETVSLCMLKQNMTEAANTINPACCKTYLQNMILFSTQKWYLNYRNYT